MNQTTGALSDTGNVTCTGRQTYYIKSLQASAGSSTWSQVSFISRNIATGGSGPGVEVPGSYSGGPNYTTLFGTCTPGPCQVEHNNLNKMCGGSENVDLATFNEQTCTGGECKKKCNEPGEENYNEAAARCDNQARPMTSYLYESCEGVCGCSQAQVDSAKTACGVYGMAAFNDVTCSGICKSCDDLGQEAETVCGPDVVANSWTCDDEGTVEFVDCGGVIKNNGPDPTPTDTPPVKDPPPDPEDPVVPDPEKTPEENALPVLDAIQKNQGKQLQQGDETNQYLENIAKNIKTTEDNNQERYEDERGLLGDIIDALEDLWPDSVVPEYSTEGLGQAGDIGERYSQMTTSMKNSPVFGLTGGMSNIPGGSPTLAINLGERFGGITNIDMSNYDTAWSVLRAAMLVVFSWLSIRIIILKR